MKRPAAPQQVSCGPTPHEEQVLEDEGEATDSSEAAGPEQALEDEEEEEQVDESEVEAGSTCAHYISNLVLAKPW